MTKKTEWLFALSSLYTKAFKQIDRRLSMHGITFSEFFVMKQLATNPENTMRRVDLAECVGMSASGITRALAPMEKIGLVEKEKNPRDARVSLVKLTDTGVRVFEEAMATVDGSAEMMLERLGEHDIEAFLTLAKEI